MDTTIDPSAARPAAELVARHRDSGHWRAGTVLDDLERWAARTPSATAVVGVTADGAQHTLTYAELASTVTRYAAGLDRLGVGPGDVVSTWLPTRWELGALMLACQRVGAVTSPMMPTFGAREVERMAARVGSSVFVTADAAAGVEHAAALAAMAPRLPALRHQVVLGSPGPGQRSFADCLDTESDTESDTGVPRADDPDAVSTILFTSGTTGEPKAVLHSTNTQTSAQSTLLDERYPLRPGGTVYTPHTLSHVTGGLTFMTTVARGATVVVTEQWDPGLAAGIIERLGVTLFFGAPVFLQQLLETLPAGTANLTDVFVLGMAPPRALVHEIPRRWGVPLRTVWGMTEAMLVCTLPDDPQDAAAHSIGTPARELEVELRTEDGAPATVERPGRMLVRGAGVCLAVAGRDSAPLRRVADHDDGWYDTGDLAAPDGRGGIRLVGRAADRVGGAFMIPVGDVEDALREHPAVADVAFIETPGDPEPVPCAVVVPVAGAAAPTLDQLRSFLLDQDMTEWFLPRRVEVLDVLPRNASGKVEKARLREHYAAAAGRSDR